VLCRPVHHRHVMGLVHQEWHPRDALRDTIVAFWDVAGRGSVGASSTILPNAYVEIVINRGDPVTWRGCGFAGLQPGRSWLISSTARSRCDTEREFKRSVSGFTWRAR